MTDQSVINYSKSSIAASNLPRFELTPDFSRNSQAKAQVSVQSRFQTRSFTTRLESFANQHGVTIESVYLAALATLLSRYSGETQIVMGVGEYTVRLDLSGDPRFSELLLRVPEVPIPVHFSITGIEIRAEHGIHGFHLTCEFDGQLFRSGTIERLLHHLESLLADIQRDPHHKISECSFLPLEERERLLFEWNATSADYPHQLPIHTLVERRAERDPQSIAITCGTETLSFGELDARANRLAHYLVQRGAGPGAVIGIHLDRSFDMVVSIAAILKTGSAYVPLDPAFPASRLEFMAEDANIAAVITTSALTASIKTKAPAILFDQERAAIDCLPASALGRAVDAESLAYVLYTSGSTGKPKGVQVQHRSVVNLLCAIQAHVQLKPGDALLAVTTLSFDIAGLELLLPLMTGSRIVLASQTEASDPMALRDLLQRTQPVLMQATPSTWRMLIDAGWNGSKSLKILVGGEKVTREVADALLDRGAEVWNVYGPTETTIWSTICRLEKDGQPVTIGRPLANTSLFVLDANRRLLPQGISGELYIGGDGVALGYLNRPELTAERFVPNPFGTGRLYRTGDIVRYQPDGRLEILGRNDAQVKVRGFRIELGDVEEALAACPQVRAAAVVVRTAASGESVLAGYFVPDPSAQTNVSEIRSQLAKRLPEYMVPTFLVPMKALPLTLNGKIDRKALPVPDVEVAPDAAPEPVKDRLEATLIGIWEAVLGVRPIGRTQNFFDLGGHSVLAAKAFARMERTLGTALPLATLFQAPTVEKLAQVIRNSNWKPLWSSLVAIRPEGTKPPFFFVHPIGGNVLTFVGFCGHFGPDRPIYGLQARGLDGEEAPHTLITEMAQDYIRGMRSVQPEGPYFIGGFSAGGVVAFEMAHQLRAAGQHVAVLALLDTDVSGMQTAEGPIEVRLRRWVRIVKMNLRYASKMRLPEFLSRKSSNFRMRRKVFFCAIRERLGLEVQPAKLSAEEAFLLAIRRYSPKPYPGSATLFRSGDGSDDPEPKMGWERLIEGHLDIQQVSGDHDTILQEPHIRMLARLLEDCLEAAPRREIQKPNSLAPTEAVERIPRWTPAIDLGKP
jgi:amino acid adenylation domain-containing protein